MSNINLVIILQSQWRVLKMEMLSLVCYAVIPRYRDHWARDEQRISPNHPFFTIVVFLPFLAWSIRGNMPVYNLESLSHGGPVTCRVLETLIWLHFCLSCFASFRQNWKHLLSVLSDGFRNLYWRSSAKVKNIFKFEVKESALNRPCFKIAHSLYQYNFATHFYITICTVYQFISMGTNPILGLHISLVH